MGKKTAYSGPNMLQELGNYVSVTESSLISHLYSAPLHLRHPLFASANISRATIAIVRVGRHSHSVSPVVQILAPV